MTPLSNVFAASDSNVDQHPEGVDVSNVLVVRVRYEMDYDVVFWEYGIPPLLKLTGAKATERSDVAGLVGIHTIFYDRSKEDAK